MTNNKINFWMVVSFCLIGIIVGAAATFLVLKYWPEKDKTPPAPEVKKYSFVVDGYGAVGDVSAKATIVEFSDYQCPACAAFHGQIFSALKTKYIDTGKVRFVSKDFPLFNMHPYALKAAEASHCALEQGKFWEMHNLLYSRQKTWTASKNLTKTFTDFAAELSLDSKGFKNCLDSEKYQQTIFDSSKEAADAEIEGTPTFYINGEKVFFGAYPLESFDTVLKKFGVE